MTIIRVRNTSVVCCVGGIGHCDVKIQADEANVVGLSLEDELAGLSCAGSAGIIRVLDVGAVATDCSSASCIPHLATDTKS